MSTAFITGITGQDGSYLAELLLEKGYEVHGIIRRSSTMHTERIDHLYEDPNSPNPRLILHYCDLSEAARLSHLLATIQPDEVYHLGAQTHVRASFDMPEYTADITGLGTLRLLEAVRHACPAAKFYNAASSEMYGQAAEPRQSETTPFHPRSPYAVAKVFAYWATVNYRESYDLFACNGILFNHESPRRGHTFVTRKITRAIAGILAGTQDTLYLGNLDAKRDWGYSKEYVEATWLMLQQNQPDDYVIATGKTHSVREFLNEAFACVGLNWEDYVSIQPRYFRPAEVDELCGNAAKAKAKLGWEPTTTFPELVRIMVAADLEAAGLPAEELMKDSALCATR